jgi:RNA polymerase sigma factor (sigma-70 family)
MTEQDIAVAYPAMMRVAKRMLYNRSDAQDAVQAALVNAWRWRETFDGNSTLKTWLCSIVKHKCGNVLRSRKRHREVQFNFEWVAQKGPTTEERMVTSEITELMWVEINRIPADLRLPLVTLASGNEQLKQAAADRGIGEDTMKSRADRGKRFLRQRMQKYL